MAWNDAGGIPLLQIVDQRKPAEDRAVERRHMHGEEEIAQEQRVGRGFEVFKISVHLSKEGFRKFLKFLRTSPGSLSWFRFTQRTTVKQF